MVVINVKFVALCCGQVALSDFQKNMMNDHWADLGLDYQNTPFDFAAIYGNTNPVILEIGFGMGKSLVDMAESKS